MKTSKQFSLDYRDILKGLLMSILTPALFIVQQSLDKGELVFNYKQVAVAAVAGGVAYLIKNFLTPSKTIINNR